MPSVAPAPPPAREADAAAIARARAGDPSGLGELYDRHAPALYRCVLAPGCAGDAASAQDILHETFVKAMRGVAGLRHPERGAYPWLRAIALNALRDHWRRAGQEERGARLLAALALDPTASPPPPDASADEARALTVRERVRGALARITERYRAALTHRFVDGLDGQAAAQRLGVTRATFDVILHRACKAFRRVYGPLEEER